MRRNENFTLTEICDTPYILPYGQMIADHKRGIQTNAAGMVIWNLLADDMTEEELLTACADKFFAEEFEKAQLSEDIRAFLSQLSAHGMLIKELPVENEPFYGVYSLGGLRVKFRGASECFSREFAPFKVSKKEALLAPSDQTIIVKICKPPVCADARLILRNNDLHILETRDRYLFLFPTYPDILEAAVTKDASEAYFYCNPSSYCCFRGNLFHAIRTVFLYRAWTLDKLVIHSASILYRDKIWLFSGHSGMGKSTHVNLWVSLYQTPIINGDLNLFSAEGSKPVVSGIPWCGTSGICDARTYPLGGIILLNQAPRDEVVPLSESAKRLLVSQRLISPSWSPEMLRHNLSLVDRVVSDIMVCKLRCTKENSAAETIKKYIDDFLNQ